MGQEAAAEEDGVEWEGDVQVEESGEERARH